MHWVSFLPKPSGCIVRASRIRMNNLFKPCAGKLTSMLKLIVIFSVPVFAGYLLYSLWPTIMLESIKWQRIINEELSNLLYEAKQNHLTACLSLLGLSFVYGVLHSVGPGHGKMIVTTFLATHPTKIKHGLLLTILSAFMQAIVAVLLVTILLLFFNNSMRDINNKAAELITLSGLIMAVLGIVIVFHAVKTFFQQKMTNHQHQEFVSAEQLNKAVSWQAYLGIVVSIGIRPCTGAVMVLLFANMIGIYWLGVSSALLMAMGTAITTSSIALLTISGKKVINRYLSRDEHTPSISNMVVQLIGGGLLILFAFVLFSTPSSGISPVF
jgi:nickel/cobalt exporter